MYSQLKNCILVTALLMLVSLKAPFSSNEESDTMVLNPVCCTCTSLTGQLYVLHPDGNFRGGGGGVQ